MNILIVEDDIYFASQIQACFLKYSFSNRIDHIESYEAYIKKTPIISGYDIVLLDLNLWNYNDKNTAGFCILRSIRKYNIYIPIIIISSHSEYALLEEAFQNWAHDYIIKPFRPRELQIRIERWFRNYIFHEYFSINRYLEYYELKYDISAYEFYLREEKIELTKWSKYLFSLFFIHKEKILTHEYLSEKIWGDTEYISQRNTRIKILRLKEQLALIKLDSWIENIHGEGYMFQRKILENIS